MVAVPTYGAEVTDTLGRKGIARFDPNTGLALAPTGTVPGEPAVLSSKAGATAFQNNVQPTIDSANAATAAARKAAAARTATPMEEALPPEVLSEMDAKEAQINSWNQQAADAKSIYESLTIAAKASAAASINALTGQWQERKRLLEESNKGNVANWNQQFIRTGQAEYSPGMSADLITGKEREGQTKVKELDDQYNEAVAGVNAAVEERRFSRAAELTKTLRDIEERMHTTLIANAKEASETNRKIKEKFMQSTREMAISNIVAQGITDPAEILDYLNNTEDGQQVGDITLDEIGKVLKIVRPSEDLTGLNGDYRTFKYLQDKKDPTVEGLDYMGYLKALDIANMSGVSGDYKTFKYLQDSGDPTVQGMDYMGYLRASGNASRAPKEGPAADVFKLSNTQQSQLLTGGFTWEDISAMQGDIATYGIDQTVAGLPKEQQDLVRRTLAGSDTVAGLTSPGSQFLTKEFLASGATQKSMEDALGKKLSDYNSWYAWDTKGGNLKQMETEYNGYVETTLLPLIQQYRNAGYSDQDILKMMQ